MYLCAAARRAKHCSLMLQVRRPVKGDLLAAPVCYTYETYASGSGECIQYYPSFSNSTVDNSMSYCGLASINPAHVLDPSTCTGSNGVLDVSQCRSYTGTQSGEEVDMYLYVTAVQDTNCNAGAAGWALPCLFDLTTNRPTLGTANMCPFALMTSTTEELVSVLIHEVRSMQRHLCNFAWASYWR